MRERSNARSPHLSTARSTAMLAADRGRAMMKIYHASSFALAGLAPAAVVAPGGMAAIDLALGVAMPVHSHVAMNFVRDAMRRDATRWRERAWMTGRARCRRRDDDERGETDRRILRGDRSSAITFQRRREDRRDWRCWRSRRRRRLDCSG
jgi:hypothetical protein